MSRRQVSNEALAIIFQIAVVALAFSGTRGADSLAVYPAPGDQLKSDKYRVRVSQDSKVHNSFVYVSRPPEGVIHIRPVVGRTMSWTTVSSRGPLSVEVTKLFGQPAKEVVFSPGRSAKLLKQLDGHTVRFVINEPCYVSVNFLCEDNTAEFGQIRHGLMIFYDPPERDPPKPSDAGVVAYGPQVSLKSLGQAKVIYFAPGIHNLLDDKRMSPSGVANIRAEQTVYIAGGAFVYGCIDGRADVGTKVLGRGVLSGANYIHLSAADKSPKMERPLGGLIAFSAYDRKAKRGCPRGECKQVVSGITLVDPTFHAMQIGGKAQVDHVKLMTWHVNEDGYRCGKGGIFQDCFIQATDDHFYCHPITIQRCVFWPRWNGAVLQFGWRDLPTGGTQLSDCDVINPEWSGRGANVGILNSQLATTAKCGDVVIENLRIEGQIAALVNLHHSTNSEATLHDKEPGHIRNVMLRNVTLDRPQYWHRQARLNNTTGPGRSLIKGTKLNSGKTAFISNITFENLKIDGEWITEKNYSKHFEIDPETTKDIRFLVTQ